MNSKNAESRNAEKTVSDRYLEQYEDNFVKKWDELIDWQGRAQSEGSFFLDVLKSRNAKDVLDVAAGTGFHSVRFIEHGYRVVSVDGSANMLMQAFSNALQKGYVLHIVHADWRWLSRDLQGEFDAIFCLGNSFTHLFNEKDRHRVIAEFYSKLKYNGVLVIDQRNYDTILDKGYDCEHKYYYCGESVCAEPTIIRDDLVRFEYTFSDKASYNLDMFPLRKEYMVRLINEGGFDNVETYGDFQETYKEKDPDFFIHVANK